MCEAACEPAEKTQRRTPRIGTHDGQFHCDEVLACWLLHHTRAFKGADIVRTRDPKALQEVDIVVDVGAVYDPTNYRFDHHQREFNGTFSPEHVIKLSSVGLIYRHFGNEILRGMLPKLTDADISTIYDVIYNNFIEEIDGVDNGVSCYSPNLVPAYRVTTALADRVAAFNPRWNDPNPDPRTGFEKAMCMVGAEFMDKVDYYGNSWFPARTIIATALEIRKEVDSTGSILVLDRHVPWKDHLSDLEKLTGAYILYVLYPGENGSWRVQCVPVREGSFQSRKPLPEAWRGLGDEALSAKCGIEGGMFVHANGFTGGMKSFDSALALARLSIA